jgi:hypothetical protein
MFNGVPHTKWLYMVSSCTQKWGGEFNLQTPDVHVSLNCFKFFSYCIHFLLWVSITSQILIHDTEMSIFYTDTFEYATIIG